MVKTLAKKIEIPEGVEITLNGNMIEIKGPKGHTKKKIADPLIYIEKENNSIKLDSDKNTKKQKRLINTFTSHIKNLIKGVTEGYEYKMKICSGHFPMTVTLDKDKIIIKNFLGEKINRIAKVLHDVKVDIKGDEVTLSGVNKEDLGQTASNIEQATRITNRDRRVFMDGVWITNKAGRSM